MRENAQGNNGRSDADHVFARYWGLLKPEDVKKVRWNAKNVRGNACLGASVSTFSIEPSAHPVTVLCAWRWRVVDTTCG
jgi:hypothetical protein